MRIVTEYYRNMTEFEAGLSRPNTGKLGTSATEEESGRNPWNGTNTWEQAHNLYLYGDKETAFRLNRDLSKVKASLIAPQRKRELYYYGSSPCVSRAIIGHPKAMNRTVIIQQKTRAIHLVYNPSCNANYKAEDIFRAGFTMLETIYRLELSGVRVNLEVIPYSAYYDNIRGGETYISLLHLKSASQPLDIMRLAYPIAHTSFFRRHGFKIAEGAPILSRAPGYGREEKREIVEAELVKRLGKNFKYIKFHDIVKCGYNAEELINKLSIR